MAVKRLGCAPVKLKTKVKVNSYLWHHHRYSSLTFVRPRHHSTKDICNRSTLSAKRTTCKLHRRHTSCTAPDTAHTAASRHGTQVDTSGRTIRSAGTCLAYSCYSRTTTGHCTTDSSHDTADTHRLPRILCNCVQSYHFNSSARYISIIIIIPYISMHKLFM